MSKKGKIILALIIGFAAAIIIMSVFIYFGYSKAYGILVIPIYELMRYWRQVCRSVYRAEYGNYLRDMYVGKSCS